MEDNEEINYTIGITDKSHNDILQRLLFAYIELNKVHAEPGSKAHLLSTSIGFLQREIKTILKDCSSTHEQRN